MILSPIALFVYNRPDHTRRTIEALRKNELAAESDLIIYSDGPKKGKDVPLVGEVRKLISTIKGFRKVRVVERDHNYGLAESIITGVTETVIAHGRVIVLEDDMVTSPYFLRYMNEALDLYEHDDGVISIHGYVYPVGHTLPGPFFLRGADCWGWATWKRGWNLFETDGRKLLAELEERGLTNDFDFDGTYPYTETLHDHIAGRNDSWAVRWYASAFLRGKLTLYPGESLVQNIGLDSSGTHCGGTTVFDCRLAENPVRLERIEFAENCIARNSFASYFKRSCIKTSSHPLKRITSRIKKGIRCILRLKY